MLIGNSNSLKIFLSDIQILSYKRHSHSILISLIILDLSSILVGVLLILGKALFHVDFAAKIRSELDVTVFELELKILNEKFQTVKNGEIIVDN